MSVLFMSVDIKHKLFIDDPELDKISLDFPNYVDTIAGLILHSYPKYTVGIFGGWGTGKTTLMKNIEDKLSENDCYTVQFNAWRYSSDKNSATHSMMLEIITQLMENSGIESKVGGRLKRGAWRIIRGLKGSAEIDKDVFLAIHGLAHRWRDFYDMLPRGRAWLNRVVKKWDIITDAAQNAESEEPGTYNIILANEIKKEPILNEIEDLESIMYFIENNATFLFTMTDQELEKYRRATIIEPKIDKVVFDPDIFDSSLFQTKTDMKKNRSKQTILNQVPSSIKPVNPTKTVQVGKSGGVTEGGQIQEKIADIVEVYPDSSGMIRFRYEPTRKHCSDHRLHLFLDDISIGTTDWFGYDGRDPQLSLQTEILTIDNVSSGPHQLKLQPEGREGGCNKGYVESWSGTLYLYQ